VEVEIGIAGAAWTAAVYNPACLDCVDDVEFMASVTPAAPGVFTWGARARVGDGAWTACDGAPSVQAAEPAPLTVVSLNLRCLVDDWDARLPVMVDALAAVDPDLIGVQEMCAGGGRDNVNELLTALEARTLRAYTMERAFTHLSWGDAYDEGIAVIAAASRRDALVEELPPGAFPRKLLALRVVTEQGPIVLATTHLDHLDAATRASQAVDALAAIDGFAAEGEPVIATGDMNEAPDGAVHAAWAAAGFTDAWDALHPTDPGFTFPAAAPDARIDYVWVRGGAAAFAPAAATVGDFGSDHLGLAATLDHDSGP
jgi:endonuclease/exonuclease/phosphatase family metal-dependent hydrolase